MRLLGCIQGCILRPCCTGSGHAVYSALRVQFHPCARRLQSPCKLRWMQSTFLPAPIFFLFHSWPDRPTFLASELSSHQQQLFPNKAFRCRFEHWIAAYLILGHNLQFGMCCFILAFSSPGKKILCDVILIDKDLNKSNPSVTPFFFFPPHTSLLYWLWGSGEVGSPILKIKPINSINLAPCLLWHYHVHVKCAPQILEGKHIVAPVWCTYYLKSGSLGISSLRTYQQTKTYTHKSFCTHPHPFEIESVMHAIWANGEDTNGPNLWNHLKDNASQCQHFMLQWQSISVIVFCRDIFFGPVSLQILNHRAEKERIRHCASRRCEFFILKTHPHSHCMRLWMVSHAVGSFLV